MENVVPSEKSESLTIDKIIEKFIPVVGALFMVIGLGYLLYTSVWINLALPIRLGLWFFLSLTIIGGAFSFSDRLRYFADITIGAGVLLLYGTLIYGSRTTDLAAAVIPETATLVTAFLFTIAVAYFASMRKSKVILAIGMIGAYITPFVIGQNDAWVQNISFNAYLTYFAAINLVVFMMGREISVRNIIPLNIIGLFIGTSTLYHLSYTNGISSVSTDNFFSGEIFSALLFLFLTVVSIWSILVSAKQFEERDEGYLALGYLAPILWFIFNITALDSLTDMTRGILYAILAGSAFYGWHVLRETKTRFQHTALYAGGILSAILAFFAFVPELSVYSSIVVAYSSLIFATLFIIDTTKGERLVSYALLSLMGALLSIFHIYDETRSYQTILTIIALAPAMAAYFIASRWDNKDAKEIAKYYSSAAFIIAALLLLRDFFQYMNPGFLLFFVPPLAMLTYSYFSDKQSLEVQSSTLRASMVWFGLGFLGTFLVLIWSIYPAPTNTFLFTRTEMPTDWVLVKGIFATIILFLGLAISRRLQKTQEEKRPSFLLVIFWYTTLLLTVNYAIYAIMNDLSVSMSQGGPRAIVTTIWWVVVALYMLVAGIRKGAEYRSEKLLWLLLLALTVGKILFYDLATMGMENKIVVLMVVGGALMMFSYGVHTKGWLKETKNEA